MVVEPSDFDWILRGAGHTAQNTHAVGPFATWPRQRDVGFGGSSERERAPLSHVTFTKYARSMDVFSVQNKCDSPLRSEIVLNIMTGVLRIRHPSSRRNTRVLQDYTKAKAHVHRQKHARPK